MKLGMQVGLGPGHIVLDGDPAPLPKGPYLLWSNGWRIKMPLGMEVGFGPYNFLLDGDTAPLSKNVTRAPLPIFGPCSLWPKGSTDQDGT